MGHFQRRFILFHTPSGSRDRRCGGGGVRSDPPGGGGCERSPGGAGITQGLCTGAAIFHGRVIVETADSLFRSRAIVGDKVRLKEPLPTPKSLWESTKHPAGGGVRGRNAQSRVTAMEAPGTEGTLS